MFGPHLFTIKYFKAKSKKNLFELIVKPTKRASLVKKMKLEISSGFIKALSESQDIPYSYYNQDGEDFIEIISKTDKILQEYEKKIGLKACNRWVGQRLDEFLPDIMKGKNVEDLLKQHLMGRLYSYVNFKENVAHVLMESYAFFRVKQIQETVFGIKLAPIGFIDRLKYKMGFYVETVITVYTLPRSIIIRSAHEDAHMHLYNSSFYKCLEDLINKHKNAKERKTIEYIYKVSSLGERFAHTIQNGALYHVMKELNEYDINLVERIEKEVFLPPNKKLQKNTLTILRHILKKDKPIRFVNGLILPKREFLVKKIFRNPEESLKNFVNEDPFWNYLILNGSENFIDFGVDFLINIVKDGLEIGPDPNRIKNRLISLTNIIEKEITKNPKVNI
jgi:hypothetical protein